MIEYIIAYAPVVAVVVVVEGPVTVVVEGPVVVVVEGPVTVVVEGPVVVESVTVVVDTVQTQNNIINMINVIKRFVSNRSCCLKSTKCINTYCSCGSYHGLSQL